MRAEKSEHQRHVSIMSERVRKKLHEEVTYAIDAVGPVRDSDDKETIERLGKAVNVGLKVLDNLGKRIPALNNASSDGVVAAGEVEGALIECKLAEELIVGLPEITNTICVLRLAGSRSGRNAISGRQTDRQSILLNIKAQVEIYLEGNSKLEWKTADFFNFLRHDKRFSKKTKNGKNYVVSDKCFRKEIIQVFEDHGLTDRLSKGKAQNVNDDGKEIKKS
jgi:hypothetical protein